MVSVGKNVIESGKNVIGARGNVKRVVRCLCLCALLVGAAAMLIGCGKDKWVSEERFYVGIWEEDSNNVIHLMTDGNYELTTSQSGDKGTYELTEDALLLNSESGVQYEYPIKGDYVLAEAYEGEPVEGTALSGTYEIRHGGYGIVMEFAEDGTVTRQVYVTELMNNRIEGTYKVDDGMVTCDFRLMGTYRFIIEDGVLYDAYQYAPDYKPAPKQ